MQTNEEDLDYFKNKLEHAIKSNDEVRKIRYTTLVAELTTSLETYNKCKQQIKQESSNG